MIFFSLVFTLCRGSVRIPLNFYITCFYKTHNYNTSELSGHSSVVERLVANEKVEGSSPFARSNKALIFMEDLSKKKCVPCEGGIPPYDIDEIHKYLKRINGWSVSKNKEKNYFIEKKFIFKNFKESEKFIFSVGKISEEEGHHPDISFGWGYANIKISTHAIKGLAESDFILAAKIDKIING